MSDWLYVQNLVDDFNKKKEQELRAILLNELLKFKLQMTQSQQVGFARILNGRDIPTLPEKDLIHLCDLCYRSVKKNKDSQSP